MTDLRIAVGIKLQLGKQFPAMVGAKDFVGSENHLQFSFKGCRKSNKCVITLNPNDYYDVEFYKLTPKNLDFDPVASFDDVGVENLHEVFESFTGLFTHL